MSDFNFDLTLVERTGNIGGKPYTIKELTEEGHGKYLVAQSKCTRLDKKGNMIGTRDEALQDLRSYLVSLCLFDSEGNPVPQSVIKGWKNSTVKGLEKIIEDISELNEDDDVEDEDEDDLKNEQ